MLDMGYGRVGHDAMAEIEDMGANGKSRKDAVDRRIERRAAGDERKRVEIALYRQMRWQRRVGPGGIDRLVEPNRIDPRLVGIGGELRSEEHTSELQSLMRISYAVFCLKKNTT